ncbi:GGDEF domain-containing protein [Rhodococcus sp. X156]|uniref:GGDEF domain-containing protein n=1 Tax=Rhodococcus sp. X156 TaxID=2499145 RepID=UPI000FDB1D2E|nr:GGDEF domain-containing protein [Rhodococcus sp. X156]
MTQRGEPADVSPSAADGQRALGNALIDRARSVAETVAATVTIERRPDGVAADVVSRLIMVPCVLATELIGRYLATGEGATPSESRALADSGGPSATDNFGLADIARCYLAWRDVTISVAREEGARLGVDDELLRQVYRIVRQSCDASLVHMVREFDVKRYDLQDRLAAERAKLAHLAMHDPLTGLANRALLLDRLTHALVSPARRARQVGVLFLDLDDFKAVNDRFGHQTGDALLVAIAERLSEVLRPSDTVARLGGDEFIILCEDLSAGEEELDRLVDRVQQACADASARVGLSSEISVSVGCAVAGTGNDPEQVLAAADAAMYANKHRARLG